LLSDRKKEVKKQSISYWRRLEQRDEWRRGCWILHCLVLREAAQWYIELKRPLHILVNNAGITSADPPQTSEGNQTVYATNYLGHWLLTYLLLDTIKASAPASIINVTSKAHFILDHTKEDLTAPLVWEKFNSTDPSHLRDAYGYSKFAQICFTVELQRQLTESNAKVTVNAVHPGLIETNIFKKSISTAKELSERYNIPIITAEQAASTIVRIAEAEESTREYGKFWSDGQVSFHHPFITEEVNKRLWDVTVKQLNL